MNFFSLSLLPFAVEQSVECKFSKQCCTTSSCANPTEALRNDALIIRSHTCIVTLELIYIRNKSLTNEKSSDK